MMPDNAFWYLPMGVMYAKMFAHYVITYGNL